MRPPFSPRFLIRVLRLVPLILAVLAAPLQAVVDDAHSAAMEAATDAVKQGFKVRQEYKKGEVESGGKVAVKYQLYKGNEYWFWLGVPEDGLTLEIDAYDSKGNKVTVEKKKSGDSASVRILPPKTGTYVIVFSITAKDSGKIPWALAHGYR